MKTKLFTILSVIAILGVSAVSYGDRKDWNWYSFDANSKPISRPDVGMIPVSDCLEMRCEHGCVEHEKNGDFFGYCCPSAGNIGDNCKVDGEDVGPCCLSGHCEEGKCKSSTCQVGTKTYHEGDKISECTKCLDGKETTDLTMVTSKSMGDECTKSCGCGNGTSLQCSGGFCCPKTAPTEGQSCHVNCPCDGELNCVDGTCQKSCVKNVDWGKPCTDSCQCKDGTGEHQGWTGTCVDGICCYTECVFCGSEDYCPNSEPEEEPECVKLNTQQNQKGKDLGCCPNGTTYVNYNSSDVNNYYKEGKTAYHGYTPKKERKGCCPSEGVTSDGRCCVPEKVYTDGGEKKCCSGTVNPDKTVCCLGDTPIWDEELNKCRCDGPESFELDGHKNGSCKDSRNKLIRWENPTSCRYEAKISGSCSGRWGAYSPGVYNYGGKLGKLCGPGKDLTVFNYCTDLDGFEFEVEPYGYVCFDVYTNKGACNGNLDITLTRID